MTALKPLNFPVTRNKGMLSTKYDPFRIEADAETLEDLRTLVGMALGVGWERYALTEDSDLNERGLKLKAELLAAFKKEE